MAQPERVRFPPLPPRAHGKRASRQLGALESRRASRRSPTSLFLGRVGQRQTAILTRSRRWFDPNRAHPSRRLRGPPMSDSGSPRSWYDRNAGPIPAVGSRGSSPAWSIEQDATLIRWNARGGTGSWHPSEGLVHGQVRSARTRAGCESGLGGSTPPPSSKLGIGGVGHGQAPLVGSEPPVTRRAGSTPVASAPTKVFGRDADRQVAAPGC